MKRTTALTATLMLSLVATSLPAVAQDGGEGPRGPRGPMIQFEAMDANNDGKITQDEIEAHAAARFAETDTNGDGTISIEEMVARMTRALTEGVLEAGGSYYLPGRPHPTAAQFLRAYPRAPDFAAAKRSADPGLMFRNALWDRYLAPL